MKVWAIAKLNVWWRPVKPVGPLQVQWLLILTPKTHPHMFKTIFFKGRGLSNAGFYFLVLH